jgi:hypothetical protein
MPEQMLRLPALKWKIIDDGFGRNFCLAARALQGFSLNRENSAIRAKLRLSEHARASARRDISGFRLVVPHE